MTITYSDAHGFIVKYDDGTTEYVQRKRIKRGACAALWTPKRSDNASR